MVILGWLSKIPLRTQRKGRESSTTSNEIRVLLLEFLIFRVIYAVGLINVFKKYPGGSNDLSKTQEK